MKRTYQPMLVVVATVATSMPIALAQVQASAPEPGDGNSSVESFFQLSKATKINSPSPLMQPATVSTEEATKNSPVHRAYRFFWHVLDDAGVPMFFGHDPYVDPGIKGTYLIPSPKLPRENAVADELQQSLKVQTQVPQPAIAPTGTVTHSEPQKIPESELEGVPLPTPRDDVHDKAP